MNATGLGLILAALSAAVIAAPTSWYARGVVFDHFERPAIEQRANDAATIRIMDAANRAEQATRSKVEQANADAFELYRKALDQSNSKTAAAEQRLETEIARYEAECNPDDPTSSCCVLDQPTLDWLHAF